MTISRNSYVILPTTTDMYAQSNLINSYWARAIGRNYNAAAFNNVGPTIVAGGHSFDDGTTLTYNTKAGLTGTDHTRLRGKGIMPRPYNALGFWFVAAYNGGAATSIAITATPDPRPTGKGWLTGTDGETLQVHGGVYHTLAVSAANITDAAAKITGTIPGIISLNSNRMVYVYLSGTDVNISCFGIYATVYDG